MSATATRASGKPRASLSLDADNQWSYMKIHGDDGWDAYPVVPRRAAPARARRARPARAADHLLRRRPGRRPAREPARPSARWRPRATRSGTTRSATSPGSTATPRPSWRRSWHRAEAAIEAATGVHPTGFRGPGYSLSATTLRGPRAAGLRVRRVHAAHLHRPGRPRLLLPHRGPHRGAADRARAAVRHVVRRPPRGAPVPLARRTDRTLARAPGHDAARAQAADPRELPAHAERVLAGARRAGTSTPRCASVARVASGRRSCCTRSTSSPARTCRRSRSSPGMQHPGRREGRAASSPTSSCCSATSTSGRWASTRPRSPTQALPVRVPDFRRPSSSA